MEEENFLPVRVDRQIYPEERKMQRETQLS